MQILPFLEYGNLYDQFKFDEPWDSEHNLKLLEQMPDEYETTGDPTTITLMIVVGEGTAYEGGEGLRFRDFTDGTSNTILVVRAGADKAVPWTKPADLPFNPDDPAAAFGKIEGDHIQVLMADGSVRRLPKDIAPEQLRALLTRAGGERVDVPGAGGFSGSVSLDGEPVSGGEITFEKEATKVEVPIEKDGTFEGPSLPEGKYRIRINPESDNGESKSPDHREESRDPDSRE